MKAAIYRKYGPAEVVTVAEMPVPTPEANQILVRVHASSVNRTDTGFRSAEYVVSRFWSGLFKPTHPILGCEFAGEVVEVGSAVRTFAVGDRVCGFNDETFGGNAEYLVIAEDKAVVKVPVNFSFEQAAVLTEGAHYALHNIRVAGVKSGDQVMVYGASGAIGSAAVQLLKYYGARVVAVCGTKHVSLVQSLGADVVIDYQTEDFTKTTEKFSFIFDAVGKTSFGECRPLLTKKGIYISTELGQWGANIWYALLTPLFGGRRVLFPIPLTVKEDMDFLRQLAEEGKFTPVIDRTYPLDHITEAHRYVQSGQKVGNVVIINS